MIQRQSKILLSVSGLLISAVPISCAITGTILYHYKQSSFSNKVPIIVLLISEFISSFLIPLSFSSSSTVFNIRITTIAVSSISTFFSGVFFLRSIMFESLDIIHLFNNGLFRAFIGLFLASLLSLGISFGQHIQELFILNSQLHQQETEFEGPEDVVNSDDLQKKVKEKLISLKASAITLVDHHNTLPHEETEHTNLASNIESSKSSSKPSNNSSRNSSNNTYHHQLQENTYNRISPLDKLPIIHQVSSTSLKTTYNTNLSGFEKKNRSGDLITPMLARGRNDSVDKIILLERDALKRIPSVLLPPHLRTNEHATPLLAAPPIFKNTSPPRHSISTSLNESIILEENVTQLIPRSATFQDTFPPSIRNTEINGLRTISLEDWTKHANEMSYEDIGTTRNLLEGFKSPKRYSQVSTSSIVTDRISLEEEKVSNSKDDNDKTTEEAMKYIEDATEGLCNNEIIESAINQSQSNITLDDSDLQSPIKSRTHSPHKSIFKHHSQKSSSTSFTFKPYSLSVPSSPTKKSFKSSPRKIRIKNLSLSSIVYKEDNEPDFAYVRELQGSPSKKRISVLEPPVTPTNKGFEKVLREKTNTTPESNWSENSQKSVFPSEVIGEYDKEKWKTMERMNLVSPSADVSVIQ